MGNSKAYRERFFRNHPYCCFCGGLEMAVEIEHMPSRTMFIEKRRPKGFEFPICKNCNDVSRKSEAVVAFMSISALGIYDDNYRNIDAERISRYLVRRCPGTIDEILAGKNGNIIKQKEYRKKISDNIALVTTGQLTNQHLQLFCSKLGFATYYEKTGNILTAKGGSRSVVSTIVDVIEGAPLNYPVDFSTPMTLSQGDWEVKSQFSYRYCMTPEKDCGIFQFSFHNNLFVTTFVLDDVDSYAKDPTQWLRPGNLVSVEDERKNSFIGLNLHTNIVM